MKTKISVSQADWCLEAMMQGPCGSLSRPSSRWSMPQNSLRSPNTLLIQKRPRVKTACGRQNATTQGTVTIARNTVQTQKQTLKASERRKFMGRTP